MDISQMLKAVSPWIAAALGGPAGIAGMAIDAAAKALGASDKTVAGIKNAIAGMTPDQELALKKADQDFALQMQSRGFENIESMEGFYTNQLTAVNATMQVEGKSEKWPQYGWRPYWGFASGTAFLAVCVLVCILAYQAVLGGKPEALAMIPQLVGAFATLFAIPGAILGVASWHRGMEKRETAGGDNQP